MAVTVSGVPRDVVARKVARNQQRSGESVMATTAYRKRHQRRNIGHHQRQWRNIRGVNIGDNLAEVNRRGNSDSM